MVERPGSLPEFEAQFPDDAACARWLFGKRWPDGFRCPGCGHAKGWELGRGTLLVECARCHRQTSVTAGTVLHRSHLPLKLWFLAAERCRFSPQGWRPEPEAPERPADYRPRGSSRAPGAAQPGLDRDPASAPGGGADAAPAPVPLLPAGLRTAASAHARQLMTP